MKKPPNPPHHQSKFKLPTVYVEKMRALVRAHGAYRASLLLGCNESTIDKIVGPNMLMPHTATRVMAALDAVKM